MQSGLSLPCMDPPAEVAGGSILFLHSAVRFSLPVPHATRDTPPASRSTPQLTSRIAVRFSLPVPLVPTRLLGTFDMRAIVLVQPISPVHSPVKHI